MSKSAFTIKVFGICLLVLGVVLAISPNSLLTLFGMPETTEVWIRVVGLLVFNIGIYYWYAAKCEAESFFQASVYTRSLVIIAFALFAVLNLVRPALIIFGLVDLLGGAWTYLTLRKERIPHDLDKLPTRG
jgi:hypothetical protein